MDHMRRKTLKLDHLDCIVLDEADEMLRMGFIDDVKWVLEQSPDDIQIALFSATMPEPIRLIAQEHLTEPKEVIIKMKTSTAENVNQRYWMVSYKYKVEVLTRILEAEKFDGVLIFVRTKTETVSLVEKLEARGYICEALNGDIKQSQREKTINRFKAGKLDILVATDVAARGLDVDRIDLVINYDMPFDTETYIHRVGRTGRAGRSGEAILFAAPREKRMLRSIENATGQKISRLKLPSTKDINDQRVSEFKQQITETIEKGGLQFYREMVEDYRKEHDIPSLEIAAAIVSMMHEEKPLLVEDQPDIKSFEDWDDGGGKKRKKFKESFKPLSAGMQRYKMDIGLRHRVRPNNIVGAIANEVGIAGKDIKNIAIDEFDTYLDLPKDLPDALMDKLRKLWICNRRVETAPFSGSKPEPKSAYRAKASHRKKRSHSGPKSNKRTGKKRISRRSKKN